MKRILFWGLLLTLMAAPTLAQPAKRITVTRTEYNGWKDAIILSNGKVEAVIVPSIGRVMQFRYIGEEGVFWGNPDVAGKLVNSASKDWINFGGDKPWPAPQADWPKVTPRAWPPPIGFDANVWKAEALIANFTRMFSPELIGQKNEGGTLVKLSSPIDPNYGIRVVRYVQIDPSKPIMRIKTVFEKAEGEPRKVAIWVITQMKEGDAIFVPMPLDTQFKEGYNKQSKELPEYFNVANGLIQLKRDPKKSTKIGNDAGALLWVGPKHILKIDSPRVANAEYPDNGSSAEVYTNIDPLKYVELEMLGPLQEMKVGDKMERVNTYTLMRRREKTPDAEAREIWGANKPAK